MHENYNQLHRIVLASKEGNSYYLAPGYSKMIRDKFPEVTAAVRVADGIGSG
jgi:hypothetical protein